MDIIHQDENLIIIDDFLEESDFRFVWAYIQQETYEYVNSEKWVKAFRFTQGNPARGPVYLSEDVFDKTDNIVYPSSKGIDIIISKIIANESLFNTVVGQKGIDWKLFSARAYLYPFESGLAWHRDSNTASGAFSFYAHPEWNVEWGGELLIASPKTRDVEFPQYEVYEGGKQYLGTQLDNSFESQLLLKDGKGTYILPQPNRLVVLRAGILHCIKRVTSQPVNYARASIQGFFIDPLKQKK